MEAHRRRRDDSELVAGAIRGAIEAGCSPAQLAAVTWTAVRAARGAFDASADADIERGNFVAGRRSCDDFEETHFDPVAMLDGMAVMAACGAMDMNADADAERGNFVAGQLSCDDFEVVHFEEAHFDPFAMLDGMAVMAACDASDVQFEETHFDPFAMLDGMAVMAACDAIDMKADADFERGSVVAGQLPGHRASGAGSPTCDYFGMHYVVPHCDDADVEHFDPFAMLYGMAAVHIHVKHHGVLNCYEVEEEHFDPFAMLDGMAASLAADATSNGAAGRRAAVAGMHTCDDFEEKHHAELNYGEDVDEPAEVTHPVGDPLAMLSGMAASRHSMGGPMLGGGSPLPKEIFFGDFFDEEAEAHANLERGMHVSGQLGVVVRRLFHDGLLALRSEPTGDIAHEPKETVLGDAVHDGDALAKWYDGAASATTAAGRAGSVSARSRAGRVLWADLAADDVLGDHQEAAAVTMQPTHEEKPAPLGSPSEEAKEVVEFAEVTRFSYYPFSLLAGMAAARLSAKSMAKEAALHEDEPWAAAATLAAPIDERDAAMMAAAG